MKFYSRLWSWWSCFLFIVDLFPILLFHCYPFRYSCSDRVIEKQIILLNKLTLDIYTLSHTFVYFFMHNCYALPRVYWWLLVIYFPLFILSLSDSLRGGIKQCILRRAHRPCRVFFCILLCTQFDLYNHFGAPRVMRFVKCGRFVVKYNS